MSIKANSRESPVYTVLQMLETLRNPRVGCPWMSSRQLDEILAYTVEELHEYRQAIINVGLAGTEARQELGDLLFHVLLHATLLKEKTGVSFEMLCGDVVEKLKNRHPHVFDPSHSGFSNAEDAGRAWEDLKSQDATRASRTEETAESLADKLERIPATLSALQRAARIGEKTGSFGFDWTSPEEVFKKVVEEVGELKAAETLKHRREELGDLFFSLAQYARHLRCPPEEVADEANRKFLQRFRLMESLAIERGLSLKSMQTDQKEALWSEAKSSANLKT